MKKICPWCNSGLPQPGDIPEETRSGSRVAVCPSCRKPIRASRAERRYNLLACALLPVVVVHFFWPERVPFGLLIAAGLIVLFLGYKISQSLPEKVDAI